MDREKRESKYNSMECPFGFMQLGKKKFLWRLSYKTSGIWKEGGQKFCTEPYIVSTKCLDMRGGVKNQKYLDVFYESHLSSFCHAKTKKTQKISQSKFRVKRSLTWILTLQHNMGNRDL